MTGPSAQRLGSVIKRPVLAQSGRSSNAHAMRDTGTLLHTFVRQDLYGASGRMASRGHGIDALASRHFDSPSLSASSTATDIRCALRSWTWDFGNLVDSTFATIKDRAELHGGSFDDSHCGVLIDWFLRVDIRLRHVSKCSSRSMGYRMKSRLTATARSAALNSIRTSRRTGVRVSGREMSFSLAATLPHRLEDHLALPNPRITRAEARR